MKTWLKFRIDFRCFGVHRPGEHAVPMSEPFTRARLAPKHEQLLNNTRITPPYSLLEAEIGLVYL
jgi:hypothetical protein